MLVVTQVLRARHLAREHCNIVNSCRRGQLGSRSLAVSEQGGHCDLVARGRYSGCASVRALACDKETWLRLRETCKVGREGRDVVTLSSRSRGYS